MKTQNLTFEKARCLSIIEILQKIGHFPTKKSEKEAWFLSPFRKETQASFKVSINQNYWFDFGEAVGGNIIDLIVKLNSCSAFEALQYLNEGSFSFHQRNEYIDNSKEYNILKCKKLDNIALKDYLKCRKINLNIAESYCYEIHYLMKNKKYFSIGFKNDLNGWEIRNKYFKGGFGTKGITTIKNNSNTVVIFEGFMDFLSYLTINPNSNKNEDFIILNSISFTKSITKILLSYSLIKTYFDNDEAGKKGTEFIKMNHTSVENCSKKFQGFKDLNEYLIESKKIIV